MPIIQTPSGPAEFPDNMNMPDIEAVLQKQFGAPPVSDAAESKLTKDMPLKIGTGWNADVKPSIGQSLLTSAPGELAYGAEMGLLGLGQSASHLANAVTGFPSEQTLKGGDENISRARRQQELNRKLSATDKMPLWANPGEMIGQAAVQAPLIAALPLGAAGGLAKSVLQAAASGAVTGAVQPVTDTSSSYGAQKLAQTSGGAAVGAAVPLGLAGLGRFAKSTQLPEVQAVQKILDSLQRGKISLANAAAIITRYSDKSLSLLDTGGQSVMRLGRTLDTLGDPKVRQFLENRDADQSARVLADIKQNLANGSNIHDLGKQLIEQRENTARPLYKQAFSANKNIDSPEVDAIIATPAGIAALKSARIKMMNQQKLMGVPDAELRIQALEGGTPLPKGGVASGLKLETLDYVKRALDDQLSAARRAGNDDDVRILRGLTADLRGALDAADVTASAGPNSTKAAGGLYKQARAAFSGPSRSVDALEEGQDFLSLSPEELRDKLASLEPSDQDFFRVGAARAMQDKVNKTDKGHAFARVNASPTMRKQITAVFGKNASDFIESMGAEKIGAQTSKDVLGNSNTAGKLVDVGGASPDYAGAALHGALSHNPARAVTGPLKLWAGRKLAQTFNPMMPDVQSALGDILTRTGAPPNLTIPANVGGLSRLPARGGVPIGSAAAMALSRLLAAQGGGQPYGQ